MPGKDQKWSGGTPTEGLYKEESEPLFNMTVEEFRPPTHRHIGITQSAPMGGRTTKVVFYLYIKRYLHRTFQFTRIS